MTKLALLNPTNLGYLGFLAIPGWFVTSLRPLSLFGLFFLFWWWPYISMLWSTSTDDPKPTDWIEIGDREYYTRYFVTLIPTMLNPFVFFASIAQITGQLLVLFRYSGTPPGPSERSQSINYRLPFEGEWTVLNGSISKEHSHSWSLYTQRYAYDFVITDEKGFTYTGDGSVNDDYYCFGEPIYAPATGIVVDCRNTHRDSPNPGGSLDVFQRDIRGNYVTIDHGDEYSVLAHLVEGSVTVETGDVVQQGDLIGHCGNSGNSTEPHLHFHVQDHPSFFLGMGLPVSFHSVEVYNQNDCTVAAHEQLYVSAGERVRQLGAPNKHV